MLQGYFWPTMVKDSERHALECEKCKKFSPIHHVPSKKLTFASRPWPFIQ